MTQTSRLTKQQLRALFYKKYGRFPEHARDPTQKKEETQIASLINLNKKDSQAEIQFKSGEIGLATLIAERKRNQQTRTGSIRKLSKLRVNPRESISMSSQQLRDMR